VTGRARHRYITSLPIDQLLQTSYDRYFRTCLLADRSSLLAEVRREDAQAAGISKVVRNRLAVTRTTMGSPVYGTRKEIFGLAPRNAAIGVVSIVVLALRPEFSAQA
jgi:hypothetical protein